jgi:anti-anti-sigma factor
MSDIQTSREGDLVTAILAGAIDMRAAGDFEKALLKAIEEGGRRIVIDFARVDLLTSAGIRVLVTLTRRLQGAGGAVVLCALGPAVQRVFDISGLTKQFRIAATRADAVAALGSPASAPKRPQSSRLSQVVASLVGGRKPFDDARGRPVKAAGARRKAVGSTSRLSSQVVRLLAGRTAEPRK